MLPRSSPALDSGAGSSRSDSPRLTEIHSRYSPSFAEPPPPPPPRNTPPPPIPHVPSYQSVPSNVQQMFKRMSPAPVVPARTPAAPSYNSQALQQRGTSPVSSSVSASSGRQPMVVQNGPQVQQQLSQQMQALSLYQSSGANSAEPPPPYPLVISPTNATSAPPPPPSYSASIQNRQSPTQDFRKSPSSGIYSGSTSAGSPSPIPVATTAPPQTAISRPAPMQVRFLYFFFFSILLVLFYTIFKMTIIYTIFNFKMIFKIKILCEFDRHGAPVRPFPNRQSSCSL